MTKAKSIKVFTTGGTIDKTYFDQKSEYHVGEPQAPDVLQRANVVVDYSVTSIMQKDSLDIDAADRELICHTIAREACKQIIVTHGTDTMVETAKSLQAVKDKTIVLTGSMYPAKFRDSDAVFNLGCALIAVQLLPSGVYIAVNGRIFDPTKAKKNVAENRFEDSPVL